MSIQTFKNKELGLSVEAHIDNRQIIWFKAKEIASALGYSNTRDAISRHVPDKYRRVVNHDPLEDTHPQTIFISEPGLYALIFGSKLESAEIFRDWVFSNVLPSIRKYGQYQLFNNPYNSSVFKIENESDLHYKVVKFIQTYYPDCLLVPGLGENQDSKTKRVGSKRKGYMRGQPDLIIQNLHRHYNGMVIEFKTPKGTGNLSDAQTQLLQVYEANGYKCLTSNDYDECITNIIEYMRDTRLQCSLCARRFKNIDMLRNHRRLVHII